jgi:hypothetical protein
MPKPADKRVCDGCGLPKRLRQDGAIRQHNRIRGWSGFNRQWELCPGSGRPPREERP